MKSRAFLSVSFAVVLTTTVHAADQGWPIADKPRNPVNWLLSDIGKLFEPPQLDADKEAPKTASAAEPKSTPTRTTAEQTQTVGEVSGAPSTEQRFENPFGAILRDLAALFTPSKPTATEPPTIVEAKNFETIVVAPAKPVEEEAKPAVAATSTQNNPIAHLFKDLAALFDGSAVTTTPAEAVAMAEAPVPSITPEVTAVAEAVPATPPAANNSNPVAYLLSDIVNLFAVPTAPEAPTPAATEIVAATDATAAEAAAAQVDVTADPTVITARPPLETAGAPWRLPENGRIFDPEHSLFAASAMPQTSAPTTAVATEKVSLPETAVAADTEHLRLKAEPRPERRNYHSLGRDQVAAKTENDDSIFGNFMRNLFLVEDEPTRAPAPVAEIAEIQNRAPIETHSEPLANTISDRIVPEERLDLGYATPDAQIQETSIERIGDGPMQDIDLFVGRDITIGRAYDPAAFGANDCVERPLHASVFCLTQFEWPAEIAASFTEDTAFTLPGEGVVRYENGRISRVYTIFKAPRFADVVKFMQHRFGPPSEREIVWMPVMEAPRLPNTTFRWSAITADRRDKIILEVRNYDDQRRSFADLDHGLVRLYRDGSRPIFKHLSTMDLMLLQRRRISHAPAVQIPPTAQN